MTSRPAWRKSSYSSSNGGACVELADLGDTIGIRDSKNPVSGHVGISRRGLRVLFAQLRQR